MKWSACIFLLLLVVCQLTTLGEVLANLESRHDACEVLMGLVVELRWFVVRSSWFEVRGKVVVVCLLLVKKKEKRQRCSQRCLFLSPRHVFSNAPPLVFVLLKRVKQQRPSNCHRAKAGTGQGLDLISRNQPTSRAAEVRPFSLSRCAIPDDHLVHQAVMPLRALSNCRRSRIQLTKKTLESCKVSS